jgi:hypothetical protein
MALPQLKKVWQFSVSNFLASTGNTSTDHRNLMFKIKSLMVGTGTHPWTVVRSSNSAAVADADLWLAAGNLIWALAPAARSWIVLKQTGILSNFQVCIDLTSHADPGFSIERCVAVVVSAGAGFVGGTVNARPTAADEIVVKDDSDGPGPSDGWWFGNHWPPGGFTSVAHCIVSNDGACTRIVLHGSGTCYTLWLFDALAETPTAMTYPFIVDVFGDRITDQHVRYVDLNDTANAYTYHPGVGKIAAYFTSEGFNYACVGELLTIVNDLSGQWPLMGVGVACEQAGARGRLGGLCDLWWGSTGVGEGNTYPNDGTRAFAQFGHLVFPWNGTVPTINTPPGVDTQRPTYTIQPVLPPAPRIVPVEDD